MKKGAVISPCGKFRYRLWRIWNNSVTPKILRFILLNPSTADAETDDATVRRCIGFAQRLGFDGIEIYNLFAFRATKISDLQKANFPIGAHNDFYISLCGKHAYNDNSPVVIAWGATARNQFVGLRVAHVYGLLANERAPLYALHMLIDGTPGHPLYLPYTCKLQSLTHANRIPEVKH